MVVKNIMDIQVIMQRVAQRLHKNLEFKQKKQEENRAAAEREKKVQTAMLDIKKKYGKNAILKGLNFEDGATARERNQQIGGHKA